LSGWLERKGERSVECWGLRSQIWRYLIPRNASRARVSRLLIGKANRLQDPQVFDLSAQSGRAAASRGSVGMEITFQGLCGESADAPDNGQPKLCLVVVAVAALGAGKF
jgi:hypothetical protein